MKKIYYCIHCGKKLRGQKRKYCSNICKCRQFYKDYPEKCNLWSKRNPRPKVNNKCITCGGECGRKKYCSKDCRPRPVRIVSHLKGIARFNEKCYVCNKTFFLVHIHHKNGNHNDNDKENLIQLCPSCHMKVHHPQDISKIRNFKNYKNLSHEKLLKIIELRNKLLNHPKLTLTTNTVRKVKNVREVSELIYS